jgi:hypothetical protein
MWRMGNRSSPIHDAAQRTAWSLLEVGREVRVARVTAGRTQRIVGAQIRRSASRISRIENGKVPRVSLAELMRVTAAVGLKLYVKTYPGGRRPLDAAQLALLRAFNARLHPTWQVTLEAPMPIPGDLRAIDEVIQTDECSCAVEAFTRFADVQAQVRSSRTKQRDINADRLILLVKGSDANRRIVHEAGPVLSQAFPVKTRAALGALGAGRDPGGDCLIML